MNGDLEEIKNRQRLADHYFDNYVEHYRKGDFSKVSEFLWGTINALVYCLGLIEGEKLGKHGKVVKFLERLADERKDKELAEGLKLAEAVHANFYQNFMSKDLFDFYREKVEALINKIALILADKLQPSAEKRVD